MEYHRFSSRDIRLIFHLDTNRLNARSGLPSINQLEQWDQDGVIVLEMSETAHREASAGNNTERTRKADRHLIACDEITNVEEVRLLRVIARILCPDGVQTPSQKNDVHIVFNAGKYGAILVTNDGDSARQPGGILGNRDELSALGIGVMTDDEAVVLVRSRISIRDEYERNMAQWTGNAPPDRVGCD